MPREKMFSRRKTPLGYILLAASLVSSSNLQFLKIPGPASLPLTATHPLHPALASFSIETAFFTAYVGNASVPNVLTKNLLANLASRTGTPAEIRIGGITADSTYWRGEQKEALVNFIDSTGALRNTTVGPEIWEAVKVLPENTQITMNLDLHDLNYTGAFEAAQATVGGVPAANLMALEIGNEPDHYLSFTPANYTAIWAPWSHNISTTLGITEPKFQIAATAEDPLWPYDAPGATSQLDCVSALVAGANKFGTVKSCSEHTYQYSVCDPARAAVATLTNLVNHTRLAQYMDLWQPRIHSVRTQLGPDSFVIGEYNSVSCSGHNGTSNTFGQALWLLDTTFYAASLNISRLYIHQGGPLALQSSTQLNHGGLSFYNMWYPVDNQNGPTQVFPSYSTYLFITETLGHSKTLRMSNLYPGRQANGSTITTAGGDTSAGQLVVYGFWDDAISTTFPTKLALLNLQIYNETQAESTPRPSATFDISAFSKPQAKAGRIRRLQAPGADVMLGSLTTWAGQTFDTGVAAGKLVEERFIGGSVTVAASEAALVFLD